MQSANQFFSSHRRRAEVLAVNSIAGCKQSRQSSLIKTGVSRRDSGAGGDVFILEEKEELGCFRKAISSLSVRKCLFSVGWLDANLFVVRALTQIQRERRWGKKKKKRSHREEEKE